MFYGTAELRTTHHQARAYKAMSAGASDFKAKVKPNWPGKAFVVTPQNLVALLSYVRETGTICLKFLRFEPCNSPLLLRKLGSDRLLVFESHRQDEESFKQHDEIRRVMTDALRNDHGIEEYLISPRNFQGGYLGIMYEKGRFVIDFFGFSEHFGDGLCQVEDFDMWRTDPSRGYGGMEAGKTLIDTLKALNWSNIGILDVGSVQIPNSDRKGEILTGHRLEITIPWLV
jgi:hypothetical protein